MTSSMGSLDVTVVVAIKNMEGLLSNLKKWLSDAIDGGLEVILVLDECNDRTQEEIELFAKNSRSKLVILESPEKGPGAARSWGLQHASRSWVAFWDSDDVGNVEALVQTLVDLRQPSTNVIICQYRVATFGFDTPIEKLSDVSKTMKLEDTISNPGIWRMVFSRKFIENILFGASLMGEDQVFFARVLAKSPTIEFNKNCIYTYYKSIPNQLTSRKFDSAALEVSINEIVNLHPLPDGNYDRYLRLLTFKMSLTLLAKKEYFRFARKYLDLNKNESNRISIRKFLQAASYISKVISLNNRGGSN